MEWGVNREDGENEWQIQHQKGQNGHKYFSAEHESRWVVI